MTEGAPLRADGLGHAYPRAPGPVLQGVDVTFPAATFTALWGPSGSGKSTLLSLLGLLMPPSQGAVHVLGANAWASPRRARALRATVLAWVLQNVACLEARTALDNVAVALCPRGAERETARADAAAALDVVDLSHRQHALASELSGGELQRMTVARALAQGTPIILADEPTGQLDQRSSRTVADALRRLADAGRTVVVATHDRALADRCDAVLAVADGTVRP